MAFSRIRPALPSAVAAVVAVLVVPAPGAAQERSVGGQVVDRAGRPVPCEGALLVERELFTSCDDAGRFTLPVEGPLASGGETLVIYAPGFRDHSQLINTEQGLTVTLRRGRSRRAQSTVLSATQWRELPRRTPTADRSVDVGSARTNPARHAEAGGGYQDLNRTLHGLPGVSGDTAASARLRVRGAEPHETLTLIDGIRVQDPTHLGGLFGALDPDLARDVRVDGAAPSAVVPDSLGGAVRASYLDGPHDRFDGGADISFLGLGAHIAVDLGREKGKGARLVVAGRRSLLQAYLAAFDAAGVTDISLDTVDFGSAYARFSVPTGARSRLRFTALHMHDRALFDDVNLRHRMVGGAMQWDAEPGPRTDLFAHLSWAWEENAEPPTDTDYPGKRVFTSATHRGRILIGARQGFGVGHSLRVGLDAGPVLRRAAGELLDPVVVPAWAGLPQADRVQDTLAETSFTRDHGEFDLFAETEFVQLGPATVRVGSRISLLNASLTPRISPRVAASVPLATGTVLRGSLGLTHQDRPDLMLLGAIQPRPERALTAAFAVAQEFADIAVLEVTAWGRALDHLLVPDRDNKRWLADGTGLAGGLDVTWLLSVGRFEANAGWSFLGTRRTNPHEATFLTTVVTGGDQRHDVEAGARLLLGRTRNFTVGLGYSGASGPPSSTLSPIAQDDGSYLWSITAVNDRRLAATHRIDLRLEHRIPTRFFRLRASFELNADLGGRVFLENCAAEGVDGAPPTCGALTFWPPVRPWLGLKAEW